MTRQEFEKCLTDSIYTAEIMLKTNYISSLKTELLPKYRLQRKKLKFQDNLKTLIKQLKHLYDSALNHKLNIWERAMDENQKYVQPKAYISSLLSFQQFKFYPDVFAIMLNDVHLKLNPKTSTAQIDIIKRLIEMTINQLPTGTRQQIFNTATELQKEREVLTKTLNITGLFQGDINDADKIKYGLINFLIWTE